MDHYCKLCRTHKTEQDFAPHALKLHRCRACTRNRTAEYRGKSDNIRRLLFNLKQHCRVRGVPEGALWSKADIQRLLDSWVPPPEVAEALKQGMHAKFRILRVDEGKPFLPNNAQVRAFGA